MFRWINRYAIAVCILFAGGAAIAQPAQKIMAPADAHSKARAGEVVLVDIRTPEEWKETGVPASAHAITMNQDPRAFTTQLLNAMGGDRNRTVALICRTGNRSSALQAELNKAGFTAVVDVAEGMVGGRNGKGWIKSGLPTRPGSAASTQPMMEMKAGPK